MVKQVVASERNIGRVRNYGSPALDLISFEANEKPTGFPLLAYIFFEAAEARITSGQSKAYDTKSSVRFG